MTHHGAQNHTTVGRPASTLASKGWPSIVVAPTSAAGTIEADAKDLVPAEVDAASVDDDAAAGAGRLVAGFDDVADLVATPHAARAAAAAAMKPPRVSGESKRGCIDWEPADDDVPFRRTNLVTIAARGKLGGIAVGFRSGQPPVLVSARKALLRYWIRG